MSWPNRTACDVLEEMRKCYKTRNFCSINGLIEEMQTIANRMEAGLTDLSEEKDSHERKKEAEEETKKIQKKLAELKKELEEKENIAG